MFAPGCVIIKINSVQNKEKKKRNKTAKVQWTKMWYKNKNFGIVEMIVEIIFHDFFKIIIIIIPSRNFFYSLSGISIILLSLLRSLNF